MSVQMMASVPAVQASVKGAAERGSAAPEKEGAEGFGELLRSPDRDAGHEDAPAEQADDLGPAVAWRHRGGMDRLELISGGFQEPGEETDEQAATLLSGIAQAGAMPEMLDGDAEEPEPGRVGQAAASLAVTGKAGGLPGRREDGEGPSGETGRREAMASASAARAASEGPPPAETAERGAARRYAADRPGAAATAAGSGEPREPGAQARTERNDVLSARNHQNDRPLAAAGDGLSGRVSVLSAQSAMTPPIQPSLSATASALVSALGSDQQMAGLAREPQFLPMPRAEMPATLHTLRIQLHPAELGMVTARLTASGQQLTVDLQVERPEALQRLNGDSETIVKALRAMGFEIDRVTVQQSFSGQGSANAGAERGGGFAQQDGGAHEAPGRDARNGSGRRDGEASGGHDGGGARDGDGGRGDGVYI